MLKITISGAVAQSGRAADGKRPFFWELVGAIIGDGNLYSKNSHYRVELTGHQEKDEEYFKYLKENIEKQFGVFVKVRKRENAIRLRITSKHFFQMISSTGIPIGFGKHLKVALPKVALEDIEIAKQVIRGIMDTDGSIFTSDKKGVKNYPTLEFTSSSRKLLDQIRDILIKLGFRTGKVRKSFSKKSNTASFKLALYGRENLKKWMNTIGFSNSYKYKIAKSILGLFPAEAEDR
ncbi:MAG: hypothetical protein J7K83_03375 [Candidatus Aenigmarchaeota archaeon]|nr:hypothetical protein [Candidatus Aenigmarchaeota archaeon]